MTPAPAAAPDLGAGQWRDAEPGDVFVPQRYEPASLAAEIAATRTYERGIVELAGGGCLPAMRFADGSTKVFHPLPVAP